MDLQCMILLFLVSYGSSLSVDPPDCIMKESELITNNNSVHLIPSLQQIPVKVLELEGNH